MTITLPARKPQPMSERQRFRIATAISLVVHLVLLMFIWRAAGRPPELTRPAEPIEVSFTATPEVQPKAPPKPPAVEQVIQVHARPVHAAKSHMLGGGHPDALVVKNPSPTKSRKPSSQPASNAGGKAKAAPAPPHLLTSKNGTTPAGPVGKGSAPFGPGGKAEVPGNGPTYGPGVMGGPTPIYPKVALDQGWEGTVTLTVTVGTKGEIAAVEVAKSSGHDALDQAAVRAMRRGWTFKPGMAKGKASAGKVTVIFSFSKGEVSKG